MKYLINYAHLAHYKAQQINSKSGKEAGNFDKVISYGIDDIDRRFYKKNWDILSQRRGAGYWLWKPYIILKTMKRINDGDFIFYSDSASFWISKVDPIYKVMLDLKTCIHLFSTDQVPGNINAQQCKRDAFILMDADTSKVTHHQSIHGGFQAYINCKCAREFLKEYLEYCQNKNILTDLPNICGKENYPEFKEHKHDQSVLSILAAKYELIYDIDPSQFGNPYRYSRTPYPQLINHTRQYE